MFQEDRLFNGIWFKRIPRDMYVRGGGNNNPLLRLTKHGRQYKYWVKT